MSIPTLMLLVQGVGLPEPHQTAEQQQRPEDLNKETHLDKEGISPRRQKQKAYEWLYLDENTFCLLRRVQFFHSKRRTWEPVFMAPWRHPW